MAAKLVEINMRNAVEYLRSRSASDRRQAVIVGKGPSSNEWSPERYSNVLKIGLNEASSLPGIDLAFSVDSNNFHKLDVSPAKPLVTALYPHVERSLGGIIVYGPSEKSAGDFGLQSPLVFNLCKKRQRPGFGNLVSASKFSSGVLIELLAMCGYEVITLVGIDGGIKRARAFSSPSDSELRSLQTSYTEQFSDIRRIKKMFPGLTIKSHRTEKNVIMIGAEVEQLLPETLLKYSIESGTFLDIKFVTPRASDQYLSDDMQRKLGTPFSFQRLQLPTLGGNAGRGVYFDSDMLVFGDVYELFNFDMQGYSLVNCAATPGRSEQYALLLADLETCRWTEQSVMRRFMSGEMTYAEIMEDFSFEGNKQSLIPMQWNSQEYFDQETLNLHFTDMGSQPWLSVYNPLSDVWVQYLCQAVQASEEVRSALKESLERGWVRPSLKAQVAEGIFDSWRLPRNFKKLDRNWSPPHLVRRHQAPLTYRRRLLWTLASYKRRVLQRRQVSKALKASRLIRRTVVRSFQ